MTDSPCTFPSCLCVEVHYLVKRLRKTAALLNVDLTPSLPRHVSGQCPSRERWVPYVWQPSELSRPRSRGWGWPR